MPEKLEDLTPRCFGCRKRAYKGRVYCPRCEQELAAKAVPDDPSWKGLEARGKTYWGKTRRDPEALERHREASRRAMQARRDRLKAQGLTDRATPYKQGPYKPRRPKDG